MRLLLDTNILLDIILKREEFYKSSYGVLEKAIKSGDSMFVSASAITDIYYLIRRQTSSKRKALYSIKRILSLVNVASVDEKSIVAATKSKLDDYEDAVMDSVANSIRANYIITRNLHDYKRSIVEAISPDNYLS